jgi:periplasmic divalent cation tolerance protein
MKAGGGSCIVLITAPGMTVARRMARAALRDRLVACVNILPEIESHYWWRGRVEKSREVLLVCKTVKMKLAALERFILANHPYDTPEFLVLPIAGGNARYLAWIADSVRS